MSAIAAPAPRRRHAPPVPLLLFLGSLTLYVGVALWTGQTRQLETQGLVGLLQRMVGLVAHAGKGDSIAGEPEE